MLAAIAFALADSANNTTGAGCEVRIAVLQLAASATHEQVAHARLMSFPTAAITRTWLV
jgi:hypothetical protein